VTDGLAAGRPVILFDNAGVASSSGETPDTIEAMGEHAAAFIEAMGLPQLDVLGFSIGGCVAQALTPATPRPRAPARSCRHDTARRPARRPTSRRLEGGRQSRADDRGLPFSVL
jgi:pimeloyl-ACP methyl ester carboxylesterase